MRKVHGVLAFFVQLARAVFWVFLKIRITSAAFDPKPNPKTPRPWWCFFFFFTFFSAFFFFFRLHMAHLLFAMIAAAWRRCKLDTQNLYKQLRSAYNPMKPEASRKIPPLDEWRGIDECCSHVYCRCVASCGVIHFFF